MKKGFTLVEILVAITIFAIVITATLSLFVHAIRAQRRNLAYQELLDQTSYVMEYMSRAIRMAMKDDIAIWGYPLPPPPDCLSGNKVNYEFDVLTQCLKFRNYNNECQHFRLVPIGGGRNKLVEIIDGGAPVDLTSPYLNVSVFDVNLSGEGQGDTLQPLVAIDLEIKGREGVSIQIQTRISQRNLDTVK